MILSYRNVCLFYIPVDSPKRLSDLPSSFGLVSQVAVGVLPETEFMDHEEFM